MTLTFLHIYSTTVVNSWSWHFLPCPLAYLLPSVCTQVSAEHTETTWQICLVSQTDQSLKESCCLSFFFPILKPTALHPAFSGIGRGIIRQTTTLWMRIWGALKKCLYFGFITLTRGFSSLPSWCRTVSLLCRCFELICLKWVIGGVWEGWLCNVQ